VPVNPFFLDKSFFTILLCAVKKRIMNKFVKLIAVVCGLLLFKGQVNAQCETVLAPPPLSFFNTANNGNGGMIPVGAQDINWKVSTTGLNGNYVPAVRLAGAGVPPLHTYYMSPFPNCGWISHVVGGNHGNAGASFFYKIDFDLPCVLPCGQNGDVFCLDMNFLADNAVKEFYINGIPQAASVGYIPPNNNAKQFEAQNLVNVLLCNAWQPGSNTLIVETGSADGYQAFLAQINIDFRPLG
jgi:hypothetical protein